MSFLVAYVCVVRHASVTHTRKANKTSLHQCKTLSIMNRITSYQLFTLLLSIDHFYTFIGDKYNINKPKLKVIMYLETGKGALNATNVALALNLELGTAYNQLSELSQDHYIIRKGTNDKSYYITTSKTQTILKDAFSYLNDLIESV